MARGLKNQIVPFHQRGVLTPSASRRSNTPSQSFARQTGAVGVTRFQPPRQPVVDYLPGKWPQQLKPGLRSDISNPMPKQGLRGLGAGVEATDSAIFNQTRYVDPSSYSVYPDMRSINVVHQSSVDTKKQADAVAKFSNWLNANFPVVFRGILRARPDLLIPEFALAGLAGLSFRRRLAGMGETTTDTVNATTQSTDNALNFDLLLGTGDSTGTTTSDATVPTDTTPSTSWGQQIANLLQTMGGPLVATYEQKQLMDINVKRAEMGLPPLDSTAVAPTLNVGIPPSQMTAITNIGKVVGLGMIGLGALYLLSRKRK